MLTHLQPSLSLPITPFRGIRVKIFSFAKFIHTHPNLHFLYDSSLGFNPRILWQCWIQGAADQEVLDKVQKNRSNWRKKPKKAQKSWSRKCSWPYCTWFVVSVFYCVLIGFYIWIFWSHSVSGDFPHPELIQLFQLIQLWEKKMRVTITMPRTVVFHRKTTGYHFNLYSCTNANQYRINLNIQDKTRL